MHAKRVIDASSFYFPTQEHILNTEITQIFKDWKEDLTWVQVWELKLSDLMAEHPTVL